MAGDKPKKKKGEDAEAIVASHSALGVVAGWLGISAEEALEEAGPAEEEAAASMLTRRPAFLGLGAKYVPHHKQVGFAAALDSRLKSRLESGRKRTAARDTEEEEHAGLAAASPDAGAGVFGKQGGGSSAALKHLRQRHEAHVGAARPTAVLRAGGGRGRDGSDGDSDEEDRGRAAAFKRRKGAGEGDQGAGGEGGAAGGADDTHKRVTTADGARQGSGGPGGASSSGRGVVNGHGQGASAGGGATARLLSNPGGAMSRAQREALLFAAPVEEDASGKKKKKKKKGKGGALVGQGGVR